MKRRIISIILVLCMAASLFSGLTLSVGAADEALPEAMWIAPSASNGIPSKISLCKPYAKKSGGGGGWPGGGGGWPGWNPGGGGGQTTPTEEEGSSYQLYLPGNAAVENCYLTWDGGLTASDGEKTYASGQLPIPAPGETRTYTFTLGDETKEFEVSSYQGSEAVKPIFIEIDESQGTIEAMNSDRDHETECTGIIYIDGVQYGLPKMKGRGNYSWSNAVNKRPYNITLDKKVNLLGIDSDKTKKWSLLANVNDHTLLRNKVAYDLAYQMGIGLDSATADVWMNGKYQGTYLVTPKTDSFITDDGYLVENDNYREDSVESGGDPSFTVSGHKESDTTYATSGLLTTVKKIGKNLLEGGEETPEALTAAAVPIREYLQDAWDALGTKNGTNAKGKYYTDYFDFKKTACMYLFQEFVKNLEVDGGSIFFHRDGTTDADKLIPGPAWDYDNALGFNGTSFGGGDRLCVSGWFFKGNNSTSISFYGSSGGNLFTTVAKHDDIMDEAKKMYNIYYANFEAVSKNVLAQADLIEESALMNFVRDINETMNAYDMSSPKTTDKETKYETTYQPTDEWRDYINNLVLYTAGRAQFMSDELLDETPAEGFTADFVLGKNSSVTVYDTQDVTVGGTENPAAVYARNSETGEIDMTGEGQINFVVDLKDGYQISNIKVEPATNYKNIKGPADTGVENGYRITKVTGPVTITVETQEFVCEHEFVDGKCSKCGFEAFKVDFDCENCSVTVYPTQDLSAGGQEKAAFAYAKSDLDGSISVAGDGQVNFVVVPDAGYEVESVTAAPANYKNLKGPDETLSPNAYRVTKVTGPVTVTAKAVKTTCQHTYEAVFTAPTCQDKGYTTHTCTKCGDYYKDTEVAPLGHDLVDGKCTRCGMTAFVVSFACDHASVTVYHTQSLDGEKDENASVAYARNSDTGDYDTTGDGQVNFVVIPDDGYALESVTAEPKNYKNLKAPDETLIENGYRATKITGDFTVTVTTKKLETGDCEHEYTSEVTAPTCTTDGFTTYTCSKCGYSYEDDTVPALRHNVVDGKCTRCGQSPIKVSFACENCSVTVYETQSLDGNKAEKAKEAFARNTDTGDYDMSGDGQVNFVVIPDEGCEIESVTAEPKNYKNLKAPDETGVENGYRITKITDGFTITVKAKKLESVNYDVLKKAISDAEKLNLNLYTSITGDSVYASLKDARKALESESQQAVDAAAKALNEAVAALVLKPVLDWTELNELKARAETVDPDKYTAESFAKFLDLKAEAALDDLVMSETQEAIDRAVQKLKDALAALVEASCEHDYKTVVTKPTCTEKGYTTYTCAKCGDSYKGNEKAALGHSWDDCVVTVEPTETAKGKKLFTCQVCGVTKEEAIPELSHEHKYTPVVTAPTCIEAGYTTYTCECGDSYKADEVEALGHNFVNNVCTRCGTMEAVSPKPCPSEAFPDAPAKGNWAHEGIDYCIANEYMNGTGNGLFSPDGDVTRAQLVTIIYRIEGEPETEFKGTFADVGDGLWYSKAIEWAAANGIVNGVGEGKFDPTGVITREQIATIFFRYAKATEGEGSIEKFPDCSDAHDFAVPALGWATRKGIINGVSAEGVTYLKPLANASRAQIASIIMRYLEGSYVCGE